MAVHIFRVGLAGRLLFPGATLSYLTFRFTAVFQANPGNCFLAATTYCTTAEAAAARPALAQPQENSSSLHPAPRPIWLSDHFTHRNPKLSHIFCSLEEVNADLITPRWKQALDAQS